MTATELLGFFPSMHRLLCILALAICVSPVAAVTIDGRVTGSAYAYEANVTDSTSSTYVRSHGALRLQATDLGHRALSLTTYLRGATQRAESTDDGPAVRFYNLFLRYKDRHADVRVGRQHVFAGVGSGTIDGARLDLKRFGVGLTLFGGALTPVDSYSRGSLSDAHLWGLRLQTNGLAGVHLAVSFADRERDPTEYLRAGEFSGFLGQPQAIRRQLLGIEASRRFGLHSIRARADYDLLNENLRRGELSGRVGLAANISVETSWRHRQPSIYSGSILSVFPSEGYDEVAVRLHYRLADDLTLSTHAATVQYDDDSTQRLGVSASFGQRLTIGYRRYQGYAGGSNGLSGSMLYPLGKHVLLRADLDVTKVERFDVDNSDDLVAAVAGLTWRPNRVFSLDGQLQGLRNPSYHNDVRFLLRGSWRFRK